MIFHITSYWFLTGEILFEHIELDIGLHSDVGYFYYMYI